MGMEDNASMLHKFPVLAIHVGHFVIGLDAQVLTTEFSLHTPGKAWPT